VIRDAYAPSRFLTEREAFLQRVLTHTTIT